MRPALFRLLRAFGTPAGYALPLPTLPAVKGEEVPDRNQVVCRPRIVLDESVIVARRQWSVHGESVPRRRPRERWSSYGLRLNDWRHAAGIPERVFARAVWPGRRENSGRQTRTDNRKPQYIDFHAPLLAPLMHYIADGSPGQRVVFEEQLPAPDDFIRTDHGVFAPEFVLQLELGG